MLFAENKEFNKINKKNYNAIIKANYNLSKYSYSSVAKIIALIKQRYAILSV